jgi:hypothetical protein
MKQFIRILYARISTPTLWLRFAPWSIVSEEYQKGSVPQSPDIPEKDDVIDHPHT